MFPTERNPTALTRARDQHMFTPEEHIDNLIRHLDLVRDACRLLGKRLMAQGRADLGRLLIAHGHIHDASKFHGIEWDYLHVGGDVDATKLQLAIEQHRRTNSHHPEYWGAVGNMPEICVAEMVCDWYARAQEFGTGLRDWIETVAKKNYRIEPGSPQLGWIRNFVDLLLDSPFGR
jgi:hypothetical protein